MKRLGTRRAWIPPVLASLLALTACGTVGPDYQRPSVETPAQWKTEPGWQPAHPRDAELKGRWWRIFDDARLDRLEEAALTHSPTLAQAQARLDQARAQTAIAQSALVPHVALQGGSSRFQTSQDRPLASYSTPNSSVQQNDYNAALSVSYEIDLSGRIRRQLENARAGEAQSGADFENTRLLLCAQLALSYFSLRELDAELALLDETRQAQAQALDVVQARHELGQASALDAHQQESLLAAIDAQTATLRDQRGRFEHALATLTGVAAPDFALGTTTGPLPSPPAVAAGHPADLLERRPDIAGAERAMAAANAQIGIARSAYYPTLNLGLLYGNDSNSLPNLFVGPSTLWSLGLSATQTLFDAGRNEAGVRMAQAGYRQAEANYRQTVLTAFQEVQDGLSTGDALRQAAGALQAGVQSADQAEALTRLRYQAGAGNRLELAQSQLNRLAYQRQVLQNQGQQLLNAVQLVKALGGGWHTAPTSTQKEMTP
ncbi:MAG: efflux transporter outer membrane subunit [Curvibacter sp.]|nr:efflux transporter outer membrane subunit [Curvibacter sp.]